MHQGAETKSFQKGFDRRTGPVVSRHAGRRLDSRRSRDLHTSLAMLLDRPLQGSKRHASVPETLESAEVRRIRRAYCREACLM